jgi:hypothetical protein
VRTPVYLDSADCVFEVKLKGPRNQTVKAQLPYSLVDRKYCISVALLFPGVRSNPWHRTLRRYFAGTFCEQGTD